MSAKHLRFFALGLGALGIVFLITSQAVPWASIHSLGDEEGELYQWGAIEHDRSGGEGCTRTFLGGAWGDCDSSDRECDNCGLRHLQSGMVLAGLALIVGAAGIVLLALSPTRNLWSGPALLTLAAVLAPISVILTDGGADRLEDGVQDQSCFFSLCVTNSFDLHPEPGRWFGAVGGGLLWPTAGASWWAWAKRPSDAAVA